VVDDGLLLWLSVWLVAAIAVVVRHGRSGRGAGLLLAYVASFAALHWLAPAMYLLPWYWNRAYEFTVDGLRQSALAMVAFAVGAEIVVAIGGLRRPAEPLPAVSRGALSRLTTIYIVTGVVMYALIARLLAGVPTMETLVSIGSTLAVVGIALKVRNAISHRHLVAAAGWLAASAVFPVITVLGQGFLGFGFVATLLVVTFIAAQYRVRLVHVVAAALVGYLTLSVYVTYMRDRSAIREVVWSADTIERRVGRLWDTVTAGEWFDPSDTKQLDRIAERLNQNFLVGAAVHYLDARFAKFAEGETFWMALVALVPRAFWPDKPVVAGSGQLVSTYTGLYFPEGTSVGIGHVMECYVNFGTAGVIVGFLLIGMLVVGVDRAAADAVHAGDLRRFLLWYLPGLSLLQLGGALSEVTATAAASAIVVLILNFLTRNYFDAAPERPVELAPAAVEQSEVQT
jgi:hypothetical protein